MHPLAVSPSAPHHLQREVGNISPERGMARNRAPQVLPIIEANLLIRDTVRAPGRPVIEAALGASARLAIIGQNGTKSAFDIANADNPSYRPSD